VICDPACILVSMCPFFLSELNDNRFFREKVLKNISIPNFVKIRPVGADLSMQTDGRTERHDEANSRFSQFCERV